MALFSLETLRTINIDEEFASFDMNRNEESLDLLFSKIKQKWEAYVDNLIKSKDSNLEAKLFNALDLIKTRTFFYRQSNLSKITKDDILSVLDFNVSFRNSRRSLFSLQGIPKTYEPFMANIMITSDEELDEATKAEILSAIKLFIE